MLRAKRENETNIFRETEGENRKVSGFERVCPRAKQSNRSVFAFHVDPEKQLEGER